MNPFQRAMTLWPMGMRVQSLAICVLGITVVLISLRRRRP